LFVKQFLPINQKFNASVMPEFIGLFLYKYSLIFQRNFALVGVQYIEPLLDLCGFLARPVAFWRHFYTNTLIQMLHPPPCPLPSREGVFLNSLSPCGRGTPHFPSPLVGEG
jgi:hypothetical protein